MPLLSYLGFPARGHTTPGLPIVAELVRRGGEINYHSIPAYRTMIEGTGARFVEYPAGRVDHLASPVDTAEHLARSLAVTLDVLPPLLASLDPRPDLVLFDASALWGGIIARRLGLPCVACITTFALNRAMLQILRAPAHAAWAKRAFERLNDEYGANFRDHLDPMVPVADLKLVFTARAFQPAGRFFDPDHLFLGPLLAARPRDGARVDSKGSRPLAYVSLGTIFNRDHALLRHIGEALVALGWRVVVSLGDAVATTRNPWPEHVEVHAFVDQIGILSEARLFITHGGMNGVSEALSHAVPMIIVPQSVDQYVVARQTANLGAAVVIERDALSAESLATAVARIEGDRPAFVMAAEAVRRGFADVVSVDHAVTRILSLIRRERPLG